MASEMGIEFESDDEYLDWKGRKANPKKLGGIRAASFTCVVEVLESMVFLCNAANFVAYFLTSMHYPLATSANMVSNFMGTSFLLTLFGGFISDSFFTRFSTFVFFCAIELLGLILLTIQATNTSLQPAMGKTPSRSQEALLYTGLYVMATGVGGIKSSLPAHGADQVDHRDQRLVSAFFNWFFFCLCCGALLSSTVMIWVEENIGWNWSFKISIGALSLALFIFVMGFPMYRHKRPGGSPFTRIFKVLASTARNRKATPEKTVTQNANSGTNENKTDGKLKFLDKALMDNTIGASEVEETKTFLGLLPIFATTIMMNCCLSQLLTFTVQQGNIMNRKLHNFQIPTQSLTVFPLAIMLSSIPLYEHFARLLGKRNTPMSSMFNPLRRIGVGLALASASMAVAAAVEAKRRGAAEENVTLSVFWLGWQYILLGVSDMLTLGGMLEFFYSEAPVSMRSMCTSLSWCSTAMGFFISSFLVTITNSVTGKYGREWLGGVNLNENRLDLFYTILCILNFLNFLHYIYWAKRY